MDECEGLARVGYDAYGQSAEWENYEGLPMPTWDELGKRIRGHWQAAAGAIADQFAEANATAGRGEIVDSR